MSTRRNFATRLIVAVTGDIAIGIALTSACVWIIEWAALSLFLSFMLWMLSIVLSLAISQYVVHPAVNALLCDRKLDRGMAVASALASTATQVGQALWLRMQQRLADLVPAAAR